MKIKKSVLLLAVCALGALAAHAGAEGNAPVKIGDTQYATIAEAVNAASGDAVITLTGDATVSETMTIEKGKNITLDLSSYTLTSNVTDANPGALTNALITNNGTLTIIAGENGKYSAPRADSCAFINNTGTLIIGRENDESPTIFNMACFGCIYNYGGEITINFASFNAPSSKGAGCGIYNASGNTVIKSATFTGSMAFLNGYGKITVEKDTIILTGDPISSAGEYAFNGVSGDGDVKIGLIVTELNDGNAKAVATVNGVAEK